MTNPQKFSEMSFGDKVAFTAGELCLAIGRGNFQEQLWASINGFVKEAYQRGYAEGKDATIKALEKVAKTPQ